jgi:hypothetical protein
MKPVSFVLLLLPFGLAQAQAPTPQARVEIEALFARLGDSACRFERNGRWHDAARAQKHLRRKYDYLVERDQVPDTETFIDRAASRSSLSGKSYRVRCGDAAPVPSRDWFEVELARLRAATQAK